LLSTIVSSTPVRCVWVALLYIVAARTGQLFSIEPANVTPVWLPSGLMLALALVWGWRIAPGIFLGAFIGNAWAYWSWTDNGLLLRALGSATFNGVGDAVGLVVMARLIQKISQPSDWLGTRKGLASLIILGGGGAAMISSIMGVGGLQLFGHLEVGQFWRVFTTWLVGDAVGVLVMAPLVLAWMQPPRDSDVLPTPVLVGSLSYAAFITALLFDLIKLPGSWHYAAPLLLPPLFYAMMTYGLRLVYSLLAVVSVVAVMATSKGMGPLSYKGAADALLQLQLFIGVFSLSLYTMAILALEQQNVRWSLKQRQEELEHLYRQDALTGLWNRYRISEFIELELARFRREELPFGVILMDIDHFKKINDTLGHLVGDEVLRELSALLHEHIREKDLMGRWGGEEFIVIVTHTQIEALRQLADKLRELCENHRFGKRGLYVTLSVGLTMVKAGDTELLLLDRADSALYEAKQGGRNRVVTR
jgi:diguanylate cyclase (GGDEF)-like protein